MALPILDFIAKNALYEIFQQGSLIKTVTRDYSDVVAKQGESVSVILPETPTVQDAGATGPNPAWNSATPTEVNITLDKWRETKPIQVDGKTLATADRDVLAMYATPIASALVADIDSAILTVADTFTAYVGTKSTGATGPFDGTTAPDAIAEWAAYKTKFDSLSAPYADRWVVAGPTLEAAYLAQFGIYNTAGEDSELVSGFMGKKLGMNFVGHASAESGTKLGYAYHKNAIALVSRPMAQSVLTTTVGSASFNGVGLTVELWRDPSTSSEFIRGQILYGVKAVTSKGFEIHKL